MRTQAALAEPSASVLAVPRPWWGRLLILVYFLTGLTSIAYEVLWVRMLGLQFGVSIFGVIVTVAAFMAGLGGGSLLGAVVAARLKRPLLIFAILEALIALYALVMPSMFQQVDGVLGALAVNSTLSQWYTLQATAAFMVLFLPAMAMGIGFPLILRTPQQKGSSRDPFSFRDPFRSSFLLLPWFCRTFLRCRSGSNSSGL